MSEHQDETDMKRAENMKKVVDDMMKEMDNMSGLEITSFLDDQSLIGSADVLVSTKFKDSSQTSEDQIRTGSVADAIRRGLNIAEKARATKITIVIEKGNYEEVFPEPFSFTTLPDEFTLEVIGSGHVNLICLENPLQICCVNAKGIGNSQDDKDNCSGPDDCTKTVIFKNIIIFNQMKTSKSVVHIKCVNTKLVKVSFYWPCDSGIELVGCKAQFARCIFYLCKKPIIGLNVHLSILESRIQDTSEDAGRILHQSCLAVNNTDFLNCGSFKIGMGSVTGFYNCQYVHKSGSKVAVVVSRNSLATFGCTYFYGYDKAIQVERNHSVVHLAKCTFRKCHVPCAAYFMGSFYLQDCDIQSRCLLEMAHCEGSFHFTNVLMHEPSSLWILKDNASSLKNLKHNFSTEPKVIFDDIQTDPEPNCKLKSKFTKDVKAMSNLDPAFKDMFNSPMFKRCNRCLYPESNEVSEAFSKLELDSEPNQRRRFAKFKYCSKCKKVCYCSEFCQKDDWSDHKLICKLL